MAVVAATRKPGAMARACWAQACARPCGNQLLSTPFMRPVSSSACRRRASGTAPEFGEELFIHAQSLGLSPFARAQPAIAGQPCAWLLQDGPEQDLEPGGKVR